MVANTLAKAGYFGGNPENVYNARVDIVLDVYHYEQFTRDYESTYYELNKTEK